MAVSGTQIMLLGGLAVAGFVVYKKLAATTRAAAVADDLATALDDPTGGPITGRTYQAAEMEWEQRLEPEALPGGTLLFHPLRPLGPAFEKYVAVLKEHGRSPWELDDESGRPRHAVPTIIDRSRIHSVVDPNTSSVIGRIYMFNAETGQEVPLFELKKGGVANKTWLRDSELALEDSFAHAFNAACRINPDYDQWENSFPKVWMHSTYAPLADRRARCGVRYSVAR